MILVVVSYNFDHIGINQLISAAVGLDCLLDGLTLDTDEFGVLAAVSATGNAHTEWTNHKTDAYRPSDGHPADFLSG